MPLACLCLTTAAIAAAPQHADEPKPFSLQYIPETTVGHIALRPADLLKHKSVKPTADELNSFFSTTLNVKLEDLDVWCIGLFFQPDEERNRSRECAYQIFVSKRPTDYAGLIEVMAPTALKKSHNGVEYYQSRRACYLKINDRTLLLAENERSMLPLIEAGATGKAPSSWKPHWDELKNKPAAMIVDFANFTRAVENNPPPPGIFGNIVPMWEKSQVAAIGLDLTKRIQLTAVSVSTSEADATQAREAMNVGLDFARREMEEAMNQLDSQIEQIGSMPQGEQMVVGMRIAETTMQLIRKPMADIEIKQDGNTLSASATLSRISVGRAAGKLASLFRIMQSTVLAQSRANNLKHIALALHNYHSALGEFPPAYKMGKDGNGDHKVSWRVLILPFLEEQALYDQYKFDEPWDSPNNKRVTAQMPRAFRALGSKAAPTETDYFVIVGENTAFQAEKGRHFRDFTDGTSNSLLVVESRKAVHWAKPSDIEFPKDKLPKLGGISAKGFRIARADGSTGFIRNDVNAKQLRLLMTINDGNEIDESIVGVEPIDDE